MEEIIPDIDAESAPCSRLIAAGLVIMLILSPGFIMVLLQIANLGTLILLLLWAVLILSVAVVAYYIQNLRARRGLDQV